jgi:hypothetical protein
VLLPRVHQADRPSGAERSVLDPAGKHDTAIRVVHGVEEQGPQRGLRIAHGRGQLVHDRLEQLVDPRALLGGAQDRIVGIESQVGLDLLLRALDVGRDQVDLVDHRQDLEVELHRQVQVGHGLGLDALRRVDQQDRALAAHQRTSWEKSTCPGVSIRFSW